MTVATNCALSASTSERTAAWEFRFAETEAAGAETLWWFVRHVPVWRALNFKHLRFLRLLRRPPRTF